MQRDKLLNIVNILFLAAVKLYCSYISVKQYKITFFIINCMLHNRDL